MAILPFSHWVCVNGKVVLRFISYLGIHIVEIRRSEKIGKLVRAMRRARLNFGVIEKDAINPEFMSEFSSLANDLLAVSAELAREGVNVFQFPRLVKGQASPWVEMTTMIAWSDETGEEEQFVAFDCLWPAAKSGSFDAHSLGGGITYARRYTLEPAIGIAGKDSDDDGNAATGRTAKPVHSEKKIDNSRQMKLAVGESPRRFPEIDDSKQSWSL